MLVLYPGLTVTTCSSRADISRFKHNNLLVLRFGSLEQLMSNGCSTNAGADDHDVCFMR